MNHFGSTTRALALGAALALWPLGCGGKGVLTGAGGMTGSAGTGGDAGAAGGATGGISGDAGATGGGGSVAGTGGVGGAGGVAGTGGVVGTGGVAAAGGAAGTCTPVVAMHTDEGAQHLASCAVPGVYGTNPPSSGNHYGVWADYKTYETPVPWVHLVHSLEHGAVILVYNCPGGCPAEVARAQALIDTLPPVDGQVDGVGPLKLGQADPTCAAPTKRRLILVPDPKLDVRWAATAWTWTLKGSCFDEAAFAAFIKAHADQTFEDFCSAGTTTFCPVTP